MSLNKEKEVEEPVEFHKIRITLTSSKLKELESVSSDILSRAQHFAKSAPGKITTKGPVRLPTKVLKITTRKTPNGEGSKTWDTYELRIHKRIIDLHSPTEIVRKITSLRIAAGVDVEVSLAS
ncbi:hypothetical protein DV451_000648 [Geotrichum candidum]|uniref:Small ribosomal subunit protein uS10 n=2 Tax=Geotrichum TaxID=43987 RepID=A0A0J9X7X2_GEOCN|nr:hypothetical protein D0Z00_004643 [Geotrichum candidum]KAI9211356.1 hypothetical protein DS838_003775 [Geotrichum bryndzae]KAF5104413.1 hypothetical protein DV451_000648 [Geotrichum candidum]KAF5109302.1 hypothetical protein DV453_001726 [Geotrichum candidum]KAF5115019.1 hypothetical protein DV454_002559 [Geotrichum candidum]